MFFLHRSGWWFRPPYFVKEIPWKNGAGRMMPTHNFQLEASGSSIPVVGKFSLAACPSLYVNAHPIMSAGGLNEW
eukprot:symbB.v1.2.021580.t1/scaffold1870.1/size97822/3